MSTLIIWQVRQLRRIHIGLWMTRLRTIQSRAPQRDEALIEDRAGLLQEGKMKTSMTVYDNE